MWLGFNLCPDLHMQLVRDRYSSGVDFWILRWLLINRIFRQRAVQVILCCGDHEHLKIQFSIYSRLSQEGQSVRMFRHDIRYTWIQTLDQKAWVDSVGRVKGNTINTTHRKKSSEIIQESSTEEKHHLRTKITPSQVHLLKFCTIWNLLHLFAIMIVI